MKIIVRKLVIVVALSLFGIVASCGGNKEEQQILSELFEARIGIPTNSVRIIDWSQLKTSPLESCVWIVFDVNPTDWEGYEKSLGLRKEEIPGDPFALVTGRSDLETGFEGYLDDEFDVFRSRVPGTGRFFVRTIKNMKRVVYFHRDT